MASSGFSDLDELGGGLVNGQSYLVHGPLGSGKTTFALQFLLEGLRAGEAVALVARRSAPVVLGKARAFGFELEPFVRDGRLALFEYAPRVIESCTRLRDEREIVEELRADLAGPRTRLVLDPVTPLLAGSSTGSAAFRARALTQGFSQLGATTLLLCDTPEDHDAVAGFRDLVYGSLRFEPALDGSSARIVPEQLPGARLAAVAFEIEQAVGLAPAQRGGPGPGSSARMLLLVVPNRGERARLAELLGAEHRVELAEDAAEGLARMSAAPPDLVLIEKDAGSVDGAEFCRKLRASGVNVPIVLLTDRVRRVRDRVALLSAGADECLERPVDPRLLKLKVRGLLGRYDGKRDRLVGPRPPGAPAVAERDGVTSTRDLEYFVARVEREVASARELGLPFSVVAVKPPPNGDMRDLGERVERLVREYDLVCLGHEVALVLLAETDDGGLRVFLERLARSGAHGEAHADHRSFHPTEVDGAGVLQWVRERAEEVQRRPFPRALNA
jgi:DNA-binding response OmpR family regulator